MREHPGWDMRDIYYTVSNFQKMAPRRENDKTFVDEFWDDKRIWRDQDIWGS